jgi:Tol biopolymer transport system component
VRIVQHYPEQKDLVAHAHARLAALAANAGSSGASLAATRVWSGMDVSGKVSPNGRFVSFTHWSAGGNLAIRDVASGEIRQLTANSDPSDAYAEYSVPSPDSRSIAYGWSHATYDLCLVGLDGSKPRTLRVSGNGVSRQFPLAWSPDGTQLLTEFVNTDGTRDLMLVAVDDGSTRLLKGFGKNPSPGGVFSPDGRFVAWATPDGIAVFDLRTGTESPLIADRSKHAVLGWAPDGRHILFSSERSGSPDAWLIAVAEGRALGEPVFVKKDDGFRPMGFTRAGAFYYAVNNNVGNVQVAEIDPASGKVTVPLRPASGRGNTWAPDWSPDGRFLAYVLAREPHRTVVVRSLDSGEEREFELGERTIGLGASLRWFPDGKGIAVPAFEAGKGESLVRLDVQTGRITFLMPLPGSFPHFQVSPDGSTVFYVPGRTGGAARLVAHDVRSGRETTVAESPGLFSGVVSPDAHSLLVVMRDGRSQVLRIRPLAGGEAHTVIRVDGEKEAPFWGPPWWAPDGRHVYFLKGAKGQERQWHLWRVATEGGEPERLDLTVGRQMGGLRPHPDGRRLATTDFEVNLEVWAMENVLPKGTPRE